MTQSAEDMEGISRSKGLETLRWQVRAGQSRTTTMVEKLGGGGGSRQIGERGFKRGNDSVESVAIPTEREDAPVSPYGNSHYGIEAWGNAPEAPETLCGEPREERIRRGMDAL